MDNQNILIELQQLEEAYRANPPPPLDNSKIDVDFDVLWALCQGTTAPQHSATSTPASPHALLSAEVSPFLPSASPLVDDRFDVLSLRHHPHYAADFQPLRALSCEIPAPSPSSLPLLSAVPLPHLDPAHLLLVDPPLDSSDFAVSYVPSGHSADGSCIGFAQEASSALLPEGGISSMSLQRKHSALADFARGNSNNVPFTPGGIEVQEHASEASSDATKHRLAQFVHASLKALDDLQSQHLSLETTSNQQQQQQQIQQSIPHLNVLPFLDLRVTFPSTGQIVSEPTTIDPFESIFHHPDSSESTFESTSESTSESDASSSQIPASLLAPEPKISLLDLSGSQSSSADANELEAILAVTKDELARSSALQPSPSASSKPKHAEAWARTDRVNVAQFHQLVPSPALEYPFDLDRFQKEAILHLEQNESVFIAAHTSAGKTVVAEYAIALAAKHHTRAIYTSPIKALSNQKYRDFKDTFGDVGLITGDVQVSPEAACLVVTTEILRSMLYKGADLIRDVEWVIFDEVHYVNDSERGVVWEEVIIMLPRHVNLIFLSATVPNTFEFADWVGRTKRKQIWVISTDHRPTPLEHYLAVDDQLFKILDSKKTFLQIGYKNATNLFEDRNKVRTPTSSSKSSSSSSSKPSSSSSSSSSSRGGGGGSSRGGGKKSVHVPSAASGKKPNQNKGSDRGNWVKLISFLKKGDLLPAVVFVFSKKKCQQLAEGLSNVDLTAGKQQATMIHHFIESSLARLSDADRKVPQVQQMRDLLKRGIGVHHGGLLPILKEVVEILFSRGLIKVLFATETFAMGVNMPARTVLFDKIRKHDGQGFRDLLPGEYIQMSGRAGRRGLDTVGTVIILCWNQLPDSPSLFQMLTGAPTKLVSQFRLTYNMILNLLRVQDFRVEDMMKRSFSEVQSQRNVPELQQRLAAAQQELSECEAQGPIQCIYGEPDIEDYHDAVKSIQSIREWMSHYVVTSGQALSHLIPGRIVILGSLQAQPLHYAVIYQANKPHGDPPSFSLLSLFSSPYLLHPNIALAKISAVCTQKINLPADVKNATPTNATFEKVAASLQKLASRAAAEPLPMFNPIEDFKINDIEFHEQVVLHDRLSQRQSQSKCHDCVKRNEHLALVSKQSHLKELIAQTKYALSDENLFLMPEFEARLELLTRLDYVDSGKAVLIKGRVAREFNTASCELLATELIFHNVFANLEPAEMISLLSIFVFLEKTDTKPELPEKLSQVRDLVTNHAHRIADLQNECGLQVLPDDYLKETLHFGLMEIAYEWARGMPFADITALSVDIQEGSIVRCITRLAETCKEMRNVARIIGDSTLYLKAEQASLMIKRDIVFASSLYIQ